MATVSLNVEDDTLAYGPQTHHTFANIRDTSTPTPTADKLHLSSKSTDATIAYDGTKKLCDYCVMSSSVATLFPPHLGQVSSQQRMQNRESTEEPTGVPGVTLDVQVCVCVCVCGDESVNGLHVHHTVGSDCT